MSLYETETMAELFVNQGLTTEGLEIYRRLVRAAPDEMTRARRRRRVADLERALGMTAPARAAATAATAAPAAAPSLEVRRAGDRLEIEWSVPAEIGAPTLQLLLVRRTDDGIETEARTLRLEAANGRTTLGVPGLHSLRAAVGRLDGERFVPLARWA